MGFGITLKVGKCLNDFERQKAEVSLNSQVLKQLALDEIVTSMDSN